MNYHVCDACGEKLNPKRDGAGKVLLAIFEPSSGGPSQPGTGNEFLDQMLGHKRKANGPEESSFDLCYECALAMALALKKQKADVLAGRRGMLS